MSRNQSPFDRSESITNRNCSPINVTDYMECCLDKVALTEGFKNYVIKVAHGASVGDGFVGIIFKATINEESSDKELNLILKTPSESLAKRCQFGSMDLFRREVYVYNEFLPEVVKFQQEKMIPKHEGFYEFPKVYFAEYNEAANDALIIMEDLRERGFVLWDKFLPTPYENAKLIVQSLAKLHAVSFAMKILKPDLFDRFKFMNDFWAEKFVDSQMATMFKSYCDQAMSILDDNSELKNKVTQLKTNFEEILGSITRGDLAEPYAVITHGDCWSNNFMYQYRGGSASNVCLIDFQISRYSSPALDLVYFLFTCTSGEMRATHYDELLTIYHRSLKDLLDQLDGDTQSQFPFTAFLRQMKKYGKFGAIMSILLIPMLTTKHEDLPDLDNLSKQDELLKDPEKMKKILGELMKPTPNYVNRMRSSLLDLMRFGYI